MRMGRKHALLTLALWVARQDRAGGAPAAGTKAADRGQALAEATGQTRGQRQAVVKGGAKFGDPPKSFAAWRRRMRKARRTRWTKA
jgi:hypothetical protein